MLTIRKITGICITLSLILLLVSCAEAKATTQIAATTRPVYEFTEFICQNTGISVSRVVTENVSCLHDYTLQISQMKNIESAEVVVISGLGLESFFDSALNYTSKIIDASNGIDPICREEHHTVGHSHKHEQDPHIWLSPTLAKKMAYNICQGLVDVYPEQAEIFLVNLQELEEKLDELEAYGSQKLSNIFCRELITFHEGFAYFANAFNLTILEAVEEESGSQLTAEKRISLRKLIVEHNLPAIFSEVNSSTDSAQSIANTTNAKIYTLDMAMSNYDYFTAMYRNIDTIKEALG